MTFRIQAGGIYKLPFPFTALSGKKARPALALNDPDRNGDVRFLFVVVEDAVEAYGLLLATGGALGAGFQPVGLGGGQAVTIREFLAMTHRLTRSRTRLAFGALPYREPEALESSADIGRLAARLAAAESAQVERWLEQILTANRPDELFE